jgi:hypothetical protein
MPSPDNRHPVAVAAEWVSRITAIAIEIVVLIWLGRWLDSKLGTTYLSPIGLVLGPVVGFWHLMTMTVAAARKKD